MYNGQQLWSTGRGGTSGDTIFQLGGATKVVTALLMFQARELGLLASFDVPLVRPARAMGRGGSVV